jgi:MtN3 and saliva related transmembrane protein
VKTLTALTTGLALWLVYGCMKGDWVIISANGVGGGLSATVLACKLRDMFRGGAPSSS